MQSGTSDDSGTADTTVEDMQVLGETRDGDVLVAQRQAASTTTADANTPATDSRTNFGADATDKVDGAARTPRGAAHETPEMRHPDDGPQMMVRNADGEFEQVTGTATASIEQMAAEKAELRRLSKFTETNRAREEVLAMQAQRAVESRRALRQRERERTESQAIQWSTLSEDFQEQMQSVYGPEQAKLNSQESRRVNNRHWIETVPVSGIPREVWGHLDDVYQERAGFSVNMAVETEEVLVRAPSGDDGPVTAEVVERDVLKRVPGSALREAWTRAYLAQHGEAAREHYENFLSTIRERTGYEITPHAPRRRVVADIAEELAGGRDPLDAVPDVFSKWFTNGVHRVSEVNPGWVGVNVRGLVTHVFEDTHPRIESAFIVADPITGEEAKVTVWKKTALAAGINRFPGQSSMEGDGRGDEWGVLAYPEEGQWVLLSNAKPGEYRDQLTLAVTSETKMTPLHHVDEHDPSTDGAEQAPAVAAAQGVSAPPVASSEAPAGDASASDDGGVAAPAVAARASTAVSASDDDGSEMDDYEEALYTYAQELRRRASDYEEMHELVEASPPPSRDAFEAGDADSASAPPVASSDGGEDGADSSTPAGPSEAKYGWTPEAAADLEEASSSG